MSLPKWLPGGDIGLERIGLHGKLRQMYYTSSGSLSKDEGTLGSPGNGNFLD